MKRNKPWPRKVTVALHKPRRARSMAKLKKDLDMVFSLFIRAKYPKKCFTCKKTNVTLQCGHFVSRQYLATRWEEDNCRPQCVGCNIFGDGKPLDFEEELKKELGVERVEELKRMRHQILKLDIVWYTQKIAYFKSLL